jgi:hypothetical protein
MPSRAPIVKVGNATKAGRRNIMVTYHEDDVYPESQLTVTVYRNDAGMPIALVDGPTWAPAATHHTLAPVAATMSTRDNNGVETYHAMWKGVDGVGPTADDALADLYRRVCLILEGAAMLAAGCTSIVKNQL